MLLTSGMSHFVRRLTFFAVGIALVIYLLPFITDAQQGAMYREVIFNSVALIGLVVGLAVDFIQVKQQEEPPIDIEKRLKGNANASK